MSPSSTHRPLSLTLSRREGGPELAAFVFFATILPAAVANAANTGEIAAKVQSPRDVRSVTAIDRAAAKRYPGEIDRDTGEIVVTGLPLDAAYDLLVDYTSGARVEGIDLTVPPSDYVEEEPLLEEDAATIREKIAATNKFEEQVEVLAVAGNVQHAVALLNKLRTKPFFMSKPGEVVWRCELWRFERPEDTWVKVTDELFTVVYRERLQHKAYQAKNLTFDPRLGGLRPSQEQPRVELGTIEAPSEDAGVRLLGVKAGTE